MDKDSEKCPAYMYAYDPGNTACIHCSYAKSCKAACYPDGLDEEPLTPEEIENLPPAKQKRPEILGTDWLVRLCRRADYHKDKIILDMLLTGNAMSRQEFVVRITSRFPRSSINYTNRLLSSHIRFLVELGVLEAVGEDKVRVKPEILAVLKEE